jgi:uncharacterized protein (TIGR02271 family)
MIVRSPSGLSLGTLSTIAPGNFAIQRGTFFSTDRALDPAKVVDVRGNDVIYRLEEELDQPAAENNELRIGLMEEEAFVEKSTMDAGQVRIHKNVVTEHREITVPLRHEEVYVEHIPAGQARAATHVFEDEHYTIQLHEEQFKIAKRPVLKEEVRIHRESLEEQRTMAASLRHEELDLEDASQGTDRLHAEGLHTEKKDV